MSFSSLLHGQVLRRTRNLAARGRWLLGRATAATRTLPDFIIIGAQKGGTTSLYEYLSQHPDIARALRKEIRFFDEQYNKGLAWYRSFFPTFAKCHHHLRATGQRLQTGEATPEYLFDPLVPERMRGVLPGVKLIVMLRDPVSRAYSHYQHVLRRGREPLSFDESVKQELQQLRSGHDQRDPHQRYGPRTHKMYSYVSRGYYAAQIRAWLRFFEKSQFLFLRSEDFYERPNDVLQRTGSFLGLRAFEWRTSTVFNRGEYDAQIHPAIQRYLRELYRADNKELVQLLGDNFDWDHHSSQRLARQASTRRQLGDVTVPTTNLHAMR